MSGVGSISNGMMARIIEKQDATMSIMKRNADADKAMASILENTLLNKSSSIGSSFKNSFGYRGSIYNKLF